MKRERITLHAVAERSNLVLAVHKAASGKRQRGSVARWLAALEDNLVALRHAILHGTAPRGEAVRFTIHDPKRRQISAACFADRVLHHAIMNLAAPRMDAALASSVHACRPGFGVHSAVAAVQQGLRRNAWVVQVDVDGFFAHINHGVLRAQLARWFKGAEFLALLGRIIDAGAVAPGVGLPIGALTSQHFANGYLAGADRWLQGCPQVANPVRYMDDVVWFCPSRAAAQASLQGYRQYLEDALHLRLKDRVVLRPAAHGLLFCGYRITPGGVWPGPRKRRRWHEAVRRLQRAQALGVPPALLQRAHDAQVGGLLPACSQRLRLQSWWPELAANAHAGP